MVTLKQVKTFPDAFFWALRDLNFHLLLGRISAKRGEGGGGGGGGGDIFHIFGEVGKRKSLLKFVY